MNVLGQLAFAAVLAGGCSDADSTEDQREFPAIAADYCEVACRAGDECNVARDRPCLDQCLEHQLSIYEECPEEARAGAICAQKVEWTCCPEPASCAQTVGCQRAADALYECLGP